MRNEIIIQCYTMIGGLLNITGINIRYIKGLEDLKIRCDFFPNQPNFLVAPNGSGKTSFAIGLQSLNQNRLKLKELDYYRGEFSEDSELSIELDDGRLLVANCEQNEISKVFKTFVINSGLYAKQISQHFGGRSITKAKICVPDVTLRKNIPKRTKIHYSIEHIRKDYPQAIQKLLFNFQQLMHSPEFVEVLCGKPECFKNTEGPRYSGNINVFLNTFDSIIGTKAEMLASSIDCSSVQKVVPIEAISNWLADYLHEENEAFIYLNAVQLNRFCLANREEIYAVKSWNDYNHEKEVINDLLDSINTTGNELKAQEKQGSLKLSFPDKSKVSNGELDVLQFAASLAMARHELDGDHSLLVIDEVFDYLDDANLVIAQYYLLEMIEQFKGLDKSLYIVLLTHLDPALLASYRFKVKHVSFFGRDGSSAIGQYMRAILRDRDNCHNCYPEIYETISHHYFHYSEIDAIDKPVEEYLARKGMPQDMISPKKFAENIAKEMERYLAGKTYDAANVCCSLRRTVEKYAYSQLHTKEERDGYLILSKGTQCRLEYAVEKDVFIPEIMFLLGILYNDCMHLNGGIGQEQLVYRKLDNRTITRMIAETVRFCDESERVSTEA